jgi:hypothetical protein
MRTSVFLGVLLATSTAALAGGPSPAQQHPDKTAARSKTTVEGAKYQPLNIKTGLWEVTYTRNSTGEMPIPAEYASKLTPEQLARMKAAMKNSANSSHTYKSCVKKEDVDGSLLNSGDSGCKVTILKSTTSEVDGKMSCTLEGGMHGDGTMNMQALDNEHTKGITHLTVSGNGKTFNTDATISSKWLSSDCKGEE